MCGKAHPHLQEAAGNRVNVCACQSRLSDEHGCHIQPSILPKEALQLHQLCRQRPDLYRAWEFWNAKYLSYFTL